VGVDPAGSAEAGADQTGIVVVGLADSHVYVIADRSGRYTPNQWAGICVDLYHRYRADRIVAEKNFGGDMVESTIRTADPSVAIKLITSSRGKLLRAEPCAALWEQRRGHIVGSLPELEDQMCHFTHDYDRARDGSPDRLDGACFGIAELISGAAPGAYFNTTALLADGAPVPKPICTQQVFGCLVTSPRASAAVALVVLAIMPPDIPGPRALILDWRLGEMDEAISVEWLDAAYELVRACAREYRSLSDGYPTILIEEDDFGSGVFELCLMHYEQSDQIINLTRIQRSRGAPIPSLDELVEAARPKINSGMLKFAAPAFERETPFRSATANHLLAQLRKFSPELRTRLSRASVVDRTVTLLRLK
jgi:hypothetical protein